MSRAKVVSTNPARARVLFEGLEEEARRFVENNFPRAHVEPGTVVEQPVPDVELVKDNGSKETYHADSGWSGDASTATVTADTGNDGSSLA